MKVADFLATARRVFLDTAPVIYYVERYPVRSPLLDPVFEALDNGSLEAVTSAVTLSEALVAPFRLEDTQLALQFERLIVWGAGVSFTSIDQPIARAAAGLRASHRLLLPDALQVAAAVATSCDCFLTNDLALKNLGVVPVVLVDELEL